MRAANFVQETTTSIAGTAGNGDVTLTAITGFPRASTVFGATKRWVRYVLEDTVANKFEIGLGTVTSNVLSRIKPQVTWDGTTYRDGSGAAVTALAFGSTPTAGNVVFRLAPTAEDRSAQAEVWQSTVAGDPDWRDYRVSPHINATNNGGAVALVAGREYYALYKLERAGLLAGVQLEVMTAVASTHIALGLYDIGSNGLPDSLISTFNTVDSGTTGIKTDTATGTWSPAGPVWLTPGWYAIGILSDGAPAIRCGAGTMMTQLSGPFGRVDSYGHGYAVYVAQAYASGLQAAYSGSGTMLTNNGSVNMNNPWIGLKIA